jgi:hypothetical protein
VNVFGGYTKEPAPMGMADYGVGPSGAYQYSTNSSLGVVYIGSLTTQNSSGSKRMSIQLNVNLQFSNNNKQFVYWIQDIAHIDTGVSSIVFLDNVWNSSVPAGSMSAASISGNGVVAKSGSQFYYYNVASSPLPGNSIQLAYPTTFDLRVNATMSAAKQPQVKFAYNDGYGWITYDTVTFTSVNRLTALGGFVVNGFNYNPAGLYYDAELVLGGPGSGSYTTDIQSDVRLQLEYWNGHNYQLVTTAYNFGSDTAERIQNVQSLSNYNVDNGALFGQLTPESGTLRELYDPSQISIVDVKSPLASGFLYVKNALSAHAVASQYPFVNGEVTVALQPGYYELDVYKGGSLYSSGNFSLSQGQLTKLQTPIGPVRLTVSYSVRGGGSGYSSPTLTYRTGGTLQTSAIGASPSTYYADPGSSWSVSYYLPGSSSVERWVTNQTAGTATGSQTLNLVYYHQFLVTIEYTLAGRGSPPSPLLSSLAFGSSFMTQASATSPTGVWVDSGALYTITNPLSGSTSTERWQAGGSTSGTISSPTSVFPTYYHQFGYAASYSLVGGGTPTPPTISYTSLGGQASSGLSYTASTIWFDTGSSYSLTGTLIGSTQAERWQTNGATAGTASGTASLSPIYYHQYLISVSYVIGGGGTPSPPVLSYGSFGTSISVNAGNQQQNFWADSGPYAVTNPLVGSTSTERWYGQIGNGTVLAPGVITLTYSHQYYLAVSGGNLPSQWYDSGSTTTLNPQTTFGRISGSGFRITSYSEDGATAITVNPSPGTVSIQITMNSPHTLTLSSVTQYEVKLDSGGKSALNFITSPTINGDDYWYDVGAPVKVVLNGTWGRASGSGTRLVSYAIGGGSQNSVARGGGVTVLSLATIAGPQSVTTEVATQFQLRTPSGLVSSMTPPTISGDSGWYDEGTPVNVAYDYIWNVTADQSRLNGAGYDVDGSAKSVILRSGNGTFEVTTTMDKPHTINIAAIVQYHLAISGGFATHLSIMSPTGDGFYDSGSTATATTAYTWNLEGKSRQNLLSYTLDGRTSNLARAESGNFTTPTITFDGYHILVFNSVTQYLIAFRFTDNSGSNQIIPSLWIVMNGRVENVTGLRAWLDSGTTFTLASVVWENADVRPSDQTTYKVEMPANETIRGRVYEVRLKLADLLQVPVSGAQARIVLANGTVLTRTTANDGSIIVPLVPLGKFDATVSYLGASLEIHGDASRQAVAQAQTALSYPDVGVPIVIALISVIAFLVLRRRRFSLRSIFKRRRWQSSGWDIGRRRSLSIHVAEFQG